MKSVIAYALGLVLCMSLLACMPIAGEEEIYTSVVRLHILANSDSEEDQTLKLAVRDRILSTYREELDCPTEAVAEERIRALMPAMQKTAEEVLRTHGCPYSVRIDLGREPYPTRVYGALSFPAGTYLSLRIFIGEGVGENWWCVLYPPLCLSTATGETLPATPPSGLTSSTWRLVSQSGEYEIRFRLLEMLVGN